MLSRLLTQLVQTEGDEGVAAGWSFVYFFSLLAAYYVLRPLRDEMGIQLGPDVLKELFSAVFICMVGLVPVFGWLTRRFERRRLLPWLYAFFASNLLMFHGVLLFEGQQSPWVARVFFVWVSVFNLFAISVFWSFMADLFTTQQAQRLYGFIAAGGTAGALCGPVVTAALVRPLGPKGLVVVSAMLLMVCVGAIWRLRQWHARHPRLDLDGTPDEAERDEHAFKGGLLSGLVDVIRSPYLLGICGFLFAYALLSSLLYFQQTELVPKAFQNSTDRTQLLAGVDLLVNGVTLLIQIGAFAPLIRRLGTRALLMAMPAISVVGYAVLAAMPVVTILLILGVVRRAGEYAISKPARETLFNVLPPEQKYRAKNVIDTLVHRTGDTSSIWLLSGLRGLGISSGAMLWLSVPISLSWLAIAWVLGKQAVALQREKNLHT
ncbi:MAG: MFS transporter [Burkholderiales bacterium]|nr:MFS transporter [Burkholderiales bacterium]